MVYGIIGMINFAHGEIYMIGSYVTFVVLAALAMIGVDSIALLLPLALLISILVTCSYGYAVERIAYRPLRNSNRLIALISAIGMSIFLQNYVRLSQGTRDLAIPSLVSGGWVFGDESQFQATLSYMQVVIFVVTLFAMVCLTVFISKSKTGQACRACAEDLGMARLLGINIHTVISLTFVIGAALAAVAGTLLGMYYGVINPFIGFMAGLKAFTAAVLGGIGSIPGAMLGGLLLGITEALTAGYFSSEYKDVVAFTLLILVLLLKPSGILGKPEINKV